MFTTLTNWLQQAIDSFCAIMPEGNPLHEYPFMVNGLIAVILVSLVCGAVGSLVVGNRMAFFSDALAHSAFAGVALGLLLGLLTGAAEDQFLPWIFAIMVVFGVIVGLAIAFVREKTGQSSDTIIGVFFAGAIGLGAVLLKAESTRRYFPPEDFLFGNLVTVTVDDLLVLILLTCVTAAVLVWRYNQLVFTSFNPSLAHSRQISVRFCNYLFIVLLALIVNICLKTVGALLINCLLVVPAATAANLCRNMRQLFRWSMGLCLFAGVVGLWLSWEIKLPHPRTAKPIQLGSGGTIVVLSVALFFLSLLVGPLLRGRHWFRGPSKAVLHN